MGFIEVPVIGIVFVIFAVLYLAFDHGRLLFTTRSLQSNVTKVPTRQIFCYKQGSQHVEELINVSITTALNHGFKTKEAVGSRGFGSWKIIYENGCEVWGIDYNDLQNSPLSKEQLTEYKNMVFVDCELPEEAIAAVINNLGFRGYLVQLGVIDK